VFVLAKKAIKMKSHFYCALFFFTSVLYAHEPLVSSPNKFQNNFGVFKNQQAQSVSVKIDDDNVKSLLNERFLLNQNYQKLKFTQDTFSKSRSVKDATLFKSISPSVVLIVSDDSIGSGSLINSKGEILTNWHVVGKNDEVGVIFKPILDTQKISKNDIYRARVIKIDQVADLALLKVISFPVSRQPIKLGDSSEISIGSDVHAIGHPRGESWTYTKGVISQYRNDYQWSGGENEVKHMADVIQTQTPINPGNSGGPLISDSGKLIGVNSFKAGDSEGLNFAVSIDDVRNFLSRKDSRLSPIKTANKSTKCEWKTVFEGKTDDKTGDIVIYDTQCSGKSDLEIVAPYDTSKPYYLRADRNLDGKVDLLIFSNSRNDKWSLSYWDNDFDGKWDSVGFHPDGEAKPSRYEDFKSYSQRIAKK
jgi:S1-C subfamily serine protease